MLRSVGRLVVDPASGLSAARNVLIQGDRIVAVTDRPVAATRTIDARGLVVAPGFIDLLAHMRPSREPQQYKIKDGVTTVVSTHGGPVDIAGWYRSFKPNGSLVNFGTTVGDAEVWEAAGIADRYVPATKEQRREMGGLLGKRLRPEPWGSDSE